MTATPRPPGAAAQIVSLAIALVLVDEALTIRDANPAAETLFGRSVARLAGEDFLDLCRPADPRITDNLRRSEGELVARSAALRCGERDIRATLTASPVFSNPGWRVLTLWEIGPGEDLMGEDASAPGAPSILAHEIKNPLAAIRGASQLLARRSGPGEVPLAELIGSEVDRIADLVDRMQQLGSRSQEPLGPVNLHEAARNAMATVRVGRPEGPILAEEFDPSLPPVLANRALLEQVLINLLVNACDAAGTNDAALVAVRTRFGGGLVVRASDAGHAVSLPIEITVSDNGPGVSQDIREQLFRPFVSSKPHGQGLGLALVRKLVGDMGGRIVYRRDEAAGLTHFRINLAIADGDRP